jgi:hypothetical protein
VKPNNTSAEAISNSMGVSLRPSVAPVAPRSTQLPAAQVRSLTRDPGLRASIPQQAASYRPPSRKG